MNINFLSKCLVVSVIFFLASIFSRTQAESREYGVVGDDGDTITTEAQLQARVMAFADLYWATMDSALIQYSSLASTSENLLTIRTEIVYSAMDAYVIAAGPNPKHAFLDMVVLATMGRMIFEQHYDKKFGEEIAPIVKSFRAVEEDIWAVVRKILDETQQNKLLNFIEEWRRGNPDVIVISNLRILEFERISALSDLSGIDESHDAWFSTLSEATDEAEKARLLAERAMYLGSRMPLITGALINVFGSSLSHNPAVGDVLTDLKQISIASNQFGTLATELPGYITKERQAAIQQFSEMVAQEREQIIASLVTEEERLSKLLLELRQTLSEGNDMITSTHALVDFLAPIESGATSAVNTKSFDIDEYRITLEQASITIVKFHEMLKTIEKIGPEKAIMSIGEVANRFEESGKNWIHQAFILGVLLIVVFMIGAVTAMLLYRLILRRINC